MQVNSDTRATRLATRTWRSPRRWLAWLVGLPCLALAAFFLGALASALFPEAGRTQQAEGEPAVYVCASLAHTDIVLPGHDPLIDWGSVFAALSPPDLPARAYLAFGWGDLRFFQETPSWADVKVATAIGALTGQHETALRVVAINPPADNPDCLALQVDRAGRQALIGYIRATLRLDAAGLPQRRPGSEGLEAYYLARDRYTALRTCNQWAADALGAAGLPHARFAPFSFSVTWPLTGSHP